LTSSYLSNNDYNGIWKGNTLGLYYYGKYDDLGRELSGNITYTSNSNNGDMNLTQQYYDSTNSPVNNTPLKQKDLTNIKSYNLNAQLDYVHPFNKISRIETGYKGTFRLNDNDFVSDTLNYNINSYVNNTGITNHLSSENISSYAIFSSSNRNFLISWV
jgi:hypothetical protein